MDFISIKDSNMDDEYYFKKEFIHVLFSICSRFGLYYEFDEKNMMFACQHQGAFPSEFYKCLKDACDKADIPSVNIRYTTNNIFAVKLSKTPMPKTARLF